MSDNGVNLFVVDGTAAGYTVLLADNTFSTVVDAAFYGADRVDCIDGFFAFNRPGTPQFYLSDNVAITFDPLYIANKADADILVSLCVVRRELWLFGERTTQVYSNTGAADFPLQVMSGGIEHGCVAKHSVIKADGMVFWLSRSRDGQCLVLQGANYQATRISTHAIETEIWNYGDDIINCIGWSYQQLGHTVLVFVFPTANRSWCYDLSTGQWHEWQAADGGRHRGVCHAACYQRNLTGDYASNALYALDPYTYTDLGQPIRRLRSFPHIAKGGNRMFFRRLVVDMQTGTAGVDAGEPLLTLRYSDDRGSTWGQPVTAGMGRHGDAFASPQFRRLGMGRNGRVFELSWTAPDATALLGAWVEAEPVDT
jgi:hypothetical protein